MPTGAKAPRLTIDDALEVLDQLDASRLERLILVGGQAAAFWIAEYGIADPRRVTTKDIDVFLSEQRPGVAVECAKDLSGELLLVREPRVPDVARVRFSVGGVDLQIDFLRSIHGISASDLIVEQTWNKRRSDFRKNPLCNASGTRARQSPLQNL